MSDTTEAAPQATLGLATIQNAIKIIDFAADQGAFKGWAVIEQVLGVRNELNDFVTAVVPPEAAEATESPAA